MGFLLRSQEPLNRFSQTLMVASWYVLASSIKVWGNPSIIAEVVFRAPPHGDFDGEGKKFTSRFAAPSRVLDLRSY